MFTVSFPALRDLMTRELISLDGEISHFPLQHAEGPAILMPQLLLVNSAFQVLSLPLRPRATAECILSYK